MDEESPNVLIIEPFYGGSHQQLIDLLQEEIRQCSVYTLPAKKWHWRARTSALYFSQMIPQNHKYRVLFCSSVLNLAELIALRPDLSPLKKVVYFHENQLVYPVRKQQDRDFQYGYNQVLTCLVADTIIFNSTYNKDSFLCSIPSFMKLIPDHRPKGLADQIRCKCSVLHFPVKFPKTLTRTSMAKEYHKMKEDGELCCNASISMECEDTEHLGDDIKLYSRDKDAVILGTLNSEVCDNSVDDEDDGHHYPHHSHTMSFSWGTDFPKDSPCSEMLKSRDSKECEKSLLIVWPHRWEHDKNPDLFFQMLYKLKEEKCCFRLAVIGQTYTDVPSVFDEAAVHLKEHILVWGYQKTKSDYYQVLEQSDVVVSTAKHEFFGVSMLEAAYFGCFPLAPNDLAYPEIFPKECLYNTENQLLKKLRHFCQRPHLARDKHVQMDFSKYSWHTLKEQYVSLLQPVDNSRTEQEINTAAK